MKDLEFNDSIKYDVSIKLSEEDYKFIDDFSEGLASTKHNNGVCGYIDLKGKETFLFEYELVGSFHNGLAVVQNKNGLYGYINKNFKEVIPCNYIFAFNFDFDYTIVNNGVDNLIIDKKGNIIKLIDSINSVENLPKILYKNKLISKSVYKKSYLPKINEENDIVKKATKIQILGLKTYSYFNSNNEKLIEYENMEDREFHCGYVIVRLHSEDIRIYDKKGKQLKVHAYLKSKDINDPQIYSKIIEFKYKKSNYINICYKSILKFEDIEYMVEAKNLIELNEKKIAVLEDVKKSISSDNQLVDTIDTKIKSLV